MYLILGFCFLMSGGDSVIVEGLEIFAPLTEEKVAVDPDGRVYVVDGKETKIRVFNPDGTFSHEFGRAGEGPGELNAITGIHWSNGLVGVDGLYSFNLFKPEGTFVVRGFNEWGLRVITQKGVINCESHLEWETDEPRDASFWALNQKMDKDSRELLGTFRKPPRSHRCWAVMSKRMLTYNYNPTEQNMQMEVTPDGQRVFLFTTNSSLIHLFDGTSHKALPPIQLPRPLPMNDAWADSKVEQTREKLMRSPRLEAFNDTIDSHYPSMRYMNFINGKLHVVLWSKAPDKLYPVIAFDTNGKEVKPDFSAQAVLQIAGTYKDTAWVITFDKEEGEAILSRVPFAQVEELVKASPAAWYDI